ncbi:helix-turn-helix domain-containing protein [Paenibacillus urinalis]|uniref:Helix-turn-helix domain-containing protein n=1 Tax=Paenibacillus urinalis TaxID=521520 RepID=A0ABY7XEP2_9BACL|nr:MULTISPECIES: helix-turn-helix domain-containing protein [Paenibacillus]WDH98425.1 helix-turn-helix domain-containing protein [Paenibacillus urinalis]WDI02115.1 helix-turn-helix domain-containing protein [Paenibacillus urinalis]GAK40182.1 transcriptional regulator [Paenibacillus sp. TCA20]
MRNIQHLWQKRESIIVTWLVSYTAVLFIPIIISLVIYFQASDTLKGEIDRANDSLLKQVRYTIDNQVDLMKRLSMEMTWNSNLQTLMYSNISPEESSYTSYQLVQQFKLYKTSYASIDEFYIVRDSDHSVLRSGNVRDMETAFRTLHDTGNLTYEHWKDTIQRPGPSRFTVLPHLNNTELPSSIAYITHLPKGLNGRDTGSVVVMADMTRFQKPLESIAGFNEGLLLILNDNNEVLMSTRPDAPELAPFLKGQRVELSAAAAGESEIFYIPSAVSELKYALIIPSRIYWEKAEYVRSFTYISIAVSIISAILITWFFMRRNYSPIQQLVRALTDHTGTVEPQEGNELRFIQEAVLQTRTKHDEITMQLHKHEQVLRSNLINRLLKGRPDTLVPYEDAFRSFHMPLQSQDFAVILFDVENEESLYEKLPGIDINERRKLIQLIVSNVAEELVHTHQHVGYVAEVDDMMVCLVNLKADSCEPAADLHAIASEAKQFLYRYEMELTVSISGQHSSWIGIATAYQEAVDAMEYKMVLGKSGIIQHEDIRIEGALEDQYGYYYPLQVEQQLINLIKAGEVEQATDYMTEITDRNFNKPVMSLTIARCLMYNLAATMMKAINEVDRSIMERNPRFIEHITDCDTIQEMREALESLLKEVCSYAAAKRTLGITQEREDSLVRLTAQVTSYIEENYQDMNLNVNSIGEHFELKGSYLSKLFRMHTGEGLLDCIHKYRIEQAKQMMTAKQDSINEISKHVGYNDAATFIRVFKKYEGITPGKYKELY